MVENMIEPNEPHDHWGLPIDGTINIDEKEKDLITMALLDFDLKEEEKIIARKLMKKLWRK
tara:strand:- start:9 stop:191 length:183 start_codon:yes stop_codon:yes gene_type:complete